MDSTILILGLILVIVFVRYDLMLFAVFTVLALGLYAFIKGFGRASSSLKTPVKAIKEDLNADAKEVEHAHGSYPTGDYLKGIWGNFVGFLTKDNSKKKESHAAGHGNAHAGGHNAHSKGHDANSGGGHH